MAKLQNHKFADHVSWYYKLAADGRTPIRIDDVLEWSRAFKADRHIENGNIERDGVCVSTVFLGLDHSFGSGPPILWETLVFGGDSDSEMNRYSTYEEAVAGHAEMCQRVFGDALGPRPLRGIDLNFGTAERKRR